MEPTVSRKSDRFEITAESGEVAGFTQFVDTDGQRIFFHTEIGEQFGGQGLAGKVVAEALAATRDDGLRIVPVCPFVKKYVQKHDEFADIVDKVTQQSLAAIPRG